MAQHSTADKLPQHSNSRKVCEQAAGQGRKRAGVQRCWQAGRLAGRRLARTEAGTQAGREAGRKGGRLGDSLMTKSRGGS
jgi:hypothetical protein